MSDAEKTNRIKLRLGLTDDSKDALIAEYLLTAKEAILWQMYAMHKDIPDGVTDIPTKYEAVQMEACINAYSQMGAENELTHAENGISRSYAHSGIASFVESKVLPIVVVI